jgi:uracil phosphoribosyltransferase
MAGVHVSTHPLVAHHVMTLRDPATRPPEFRRVVGQLTRLLGYEATRDLPTRAVRGPTPLGTAAGSRIAERIAIVPILRAGLGMADGLLDVLPDAEIWHVGLFRGVAMAIVVDPMLATGGSAVRTCELLRDAGVPRIVCIALIAAPEGVARLERSMPGVTIHVAALDDGLDRSGFIVPGLGDAGDRQFGTAARP